MLKCLNSNQSGMTLVEALIAIALLGILATAFLSALATSFQAAALADERTIAESLARSQLETIRNAPYDDTPPYGYPKITNIPPGYDVTHNVVVIDPDTGAPSPTDRGLQKITVTVKHKDKEVIKAETYKAQR